MACQTISLLVTNNYRTNISQITIFGPYTISSIASLFWIIRIVNCFTEEANLAILLSF